MGVSSRAGAGPGGGGGAGVDSASLFDVVHGTSASRAVARNSKYLFFTLIFIALNIFL